MMILAVGRLHLWRDLALIPALEQLGRLHHAAVPQLSMLSFSAGISGCMLGCIWLQGVRIFGEILHFFERWNNWAGWGIFIGVFIVNVTLFLPGVALVLGAGYIFGCVDCQSWGNSSQEDQ